MVWIETPSNPLMKVIDISAVARLAAVAGALTVVDNTFATPYLQRPLELGADLVLHSATKYLGGHSDVVGGLIATRSDELAERLRFHQNAAGAVPSPFDCFLVMRGLRTLALRMERASANALVLALWLGERPEVERVHYPGLPDHPAAALVERQMRLPGAMLSSSCAMARSGRVASSAATRLFTLAESLGAVESLIEVPAPMTHASVADSPLAVPPALVRLSVGIENVDDLRAGPRAGVRRIGPVTEEHPREDGPTEVVETDEGELIERLSGGTATLLLVWLIGVGALSTLLAAWLFVWFVSGERLGIGALFGASGSTPPSPAPPDRASCGSPGGRRATHSAGSCSPRAKIALVMIGLVLVFIFGVALVMAGAIPGAGRPARRGRAGGGGGRPGAGLGHCHVGRGPVDRAGTARSPRSRRSRDGSAISTSPSNASEAIVRAHDPSPFTGRCVSSRRRDPPRAPQSRPRPASGGRVARAARRPPRGCAGSPR